MDNKVIVVDFKKEKEKRSIDWEYVIVSSFLLFFFGVSIMIFIKAIK